MQFFLHLVKRFEDSHLETWFLNAAIFYLPLAYIFGGQGDLDLNTNTNTNTTTNTTTNSNTNAKIQKYIQKYKNTEIQKYRNT